MRDKKDKKILWRLFQSTFALSACTFGGGFVIVSLMKKQFVEKLGWLEEDEMLDVTAIAQSSPGPIPVNASVILGYRMAGITGSFVAVLGTILPPLLIISVIAYFYEQFRSNAVISTALQVMRAGVAAVIFDVVLNLVKNIAVTQNMGAYRRNFYIFLMCVSFISAVCFGISAMTIILVCLAIGLIDLTIGLIRQKKGGK